ncbi:unnamed protein product [Paramecium octaurelia]|uniref:Transmembrane protein n=1 Tax=Paramecium octaurelia TaxID=43137 RepID=A0A8S1WT56_PAROT|nr:unnamed protein product [Paramecium octaurelia]
MHHVYHHIMHHILESVSYAHWKIAYIVLNSNAIILILTLVLNLKIQLKITLRHRLVVCCVKQTITLISNLEYVQKMLHQSRIVQYLLLNQQMRKYVQHLPQIISRCQERLIVAICQQPIVKSVFLITIRSQPAQHVNLVIYYLVESAMKVKNKVPPIKLNSENPINQIHAEVFVKLASSHWESIIVKNAIYQKESYRQMTQITCVNIVLHFVNIAYDEILQNQKQIQNGTISFTHILFIQIYKELFVPFQDPFINCDPYLKTTQYCFDGDCNNELTYEFIEDNCFFDRFPQNLDNLIFQTEYLNSIGVVSMTIIIRIKIEDEYCSLLPSIRISASLKFDVFTLQIIHFKLLATYPFYLQLQNSFYIEDFDSFTMIDYGIVFTHFNMQDLNISNSYNEVNFTLINITIKDSITENVQSLFKTKNFGYVELQYNYNQQQLYQFFALQFQRIQLNWEYQNQLITFIQLQFYQLSIV